MAQRVKLVNDFTVSHLIKIILKTYWLPIVSFMNDSKFGQLMFQLANASIHEHLFLTYLFPLSDQMNAIVLHLINFFFQC